MVRGTLLPHKWKTKLFHIYRDFQAIREMNEKKLAHDFMMTNTIISKEYILLHESIGDGVDNEDEEDQNDTRDSRKISRLLP